MTQAGIDMGDGQIQPCDFALKPITDIFRAFRWGKWFCVTGSLANLILAVWVTPRAYHRFFTSLPSVQREQWNQTLAAKQRELASPWQDKRPLLLMLGDSEIELGGWYDLYDGSRSVRNGGLSRARIADVTTLAAGSGDLHARAVILMCGINNLGAGLTVDACLRDYETLLKTVRSHLQPELTIVLAIMPVRETAMDRASHQLNLTVKHFNAMLEACCRTNQARFVNLNDAISVGNGGLAPDFTFDGLHLNPQGYRHLAAALQPSLPETQ